MNESFIPLNPAITPEPGRMDFRVAIITPAEHPQPFQLLKPGAGGGSGPRQGAGKPNVTLQRDGERVSAIRVQCACGQLLELACVYAAAPTPARTDSPAPQPVKSNPSQPGNP